MASLGELLFLLSLLFISEIRADDDHYRLPSTTRPLNYNITIWNVDFYKNFTFSGNVSILIEVFEPTTQVMLHSKKLNIKKVYLEEEKILTFSYCSRHERLTVDVGEELKKWSRHTLHVEYDGVFNDDMMGFYRSWYDMGNKRRWIVSTCFEATNARMAFPCYDEPRFRTPFMITIARNASHTAISNMPVGTSQPDSKNKEIVWDHFTPTPPMATYLVAFAVLDFKVSKAKGKNKFWSRPNALEDTNHASEIAAELFTFMEKFTKMPNIMPQTNFLALPDFDAGAMENWGLITFRETLMLYHPDLSSNENLQRSTLTIAHEISHFWFGDLVTPVWWDYLWLNEGFARYFQYHLTNQLKPSWKNDQYYVVGSFQLALHSDIGQRSLTANNVKTPEEISGLFDKITYDKGAAVIRMLEHMVSTSTFKNSLHDYLQRGWVEKAGSVTPELLWAAFDSQVKKDKVRLPKSVKELMDPWVHNPSYPLVNLLRTDSGCLQIEQVTYRSLRASKPIEEQKWIIPITYTTQSKVNFTVTKPKLWSMPSEELHLHDEVEAGEEWIILNIQSTGVYRVNYDHENWNLLIDQLMKKPQAIHQSNRAQLIDDSITLATDKYLCYHVPIKLLKYLDGETDIIPWFTAVDKLSYIYSLFQHTRMGPLVRDYIFERIHHIYHHIGFSIKASDDHLTKVFRTTFLNFACRLNFGHCLEDATKEFDKHRNELSKIPADVKEAVLCSVHFKQQNESLWLDLWSVYKSSNVAYEKVTILKTLGCTKDAEHLRKLLYKTIDESDTDIRKQDFFYVHYSCFSHSDGVLAGLKLIQDLLATISEGLGGPQISSRVTDMIGSMKNRILTKKQMNKLDDLIARAEKFGSKSLKNVIESLKNAQKSAIKTQELIRLRSDNLETALGGKGSSSIVLVPSNIAYAIIISICVVLFT